MTKIVTTNLRPFQRICRLLPQSNTTKIVATTCALHFVWENTIFSATADRPHYVEAVRGA